MKVQPLIGSQSVVVYLGDLIDRSPEENGDLRVLLVHFRRVILDQRASQLTGNHEQAFLQAYDGDDKILSTVVTLSFL